jgi:23S rRNA pseudouridine1911/1915/1917 synthase
MWVAENGKSCRTIFHKIAGKDSYSLVLAELLTGRKHQIRAHLAHLGQPLVGDKIYMIMKGNIT